MARRKQSLRDMLTLKAETFLYAAETKLHIEECDTDTLRALLLTPDFADFCLTVRDEECSLVATLTHDSMEFF